MSNARVVKITPTRTRFAMLLAADGRFLAVGADGEPALLREADDRVMWRPAKDGYRHATTGRLAKLDSGGAPSVDGVPPSAFGKLAQAAPFAATHGPERLPSDYLRCFRQDGWVCLTQLLAPAVLDGLQQVACTDAHARRERDRSQQQLNQHVAVSRTAAEPVSLWLVRQYMRTDDIRFGHTPALIVLGQDDGKRNVQGWHSDYPYHWGIRVAAQVPTNSRSTALGVQRNVCVSEFTKARGATLFKLGSHAENRGPPEAWGTAGAHAQAGYRAANGLPYDGAEADVIEAPAGSIILYDARTWHRAGVNRTPRKRAAMLQAMLPAFVMPKNDTSRSYRAFVGGAAHQALNQREREEMQRLMVHRFPGPGGTYAIGPDAELTEQLGVAQPEAY